MARTRLSTKGQVIIPKPVRDRQGWAAGTELEVEDRGDVVVLRRVEPAFPRTTIEQVRGSAKYSGPPVPIEDFDKGIAEHIRAMWEDFERQSRSTGPWSDVPPSSTAHQRHGWPKSAAKA